MRKLFSSVLALALTVCSLAALPTAASALEPTTRGQEYMEYDYFYIYKGGGAAVSDVFAQKWNDNKEMNTTVLKAPGSTINWLTSETVYWRGRSETLARATELGTTNKPIYNHKLGYLSGYGTRLSKYTIAAEYAEDNPYTHLELIIYWDPDGDE